MLIIITTHCSQLTAHCSLNLHITVLSGHWSVVTFAAPAHCSVPTCSVLITQLTFLFEAEFLASLLRAELGRWTVREESYREEGVWEEQVYLGGRGESPLSPEASDLAREEQELGRGIFWNCKVLAISEKFTGLHIFKLIKYSNILCRNLSR